jgi:RNA polymerase sigma-70 factor (ECF subfamily)
MNLDGRSPVFFLDFDVIVTANADAIAKYCYGLLLDYHEAHDAAQDVFIKAAAKLKKFTDDNHVKHWLYRTAYTTCIDILRRRKLARLFLSREKTIQPISYEDAYNLGISSELQAALDTLSPRDRALVYSRAVLGMEYAELEAIYGTKAPALRKRYERARKKLEDYLTKNKKEVQ